MGETQSQLSSHYWVSGTRWCSSVSNSRDTGFKLQPGKFNQRCFLSSVLCCLLSKLTHERLCTWSTWYPVFGDQMFHPVASTTPCSPPLTESLLFKLCSSIQNERVTWQKEKTRHDVTADLDFSQLWFDLLFSSPLATPVRVDQWTLLCVCVFWGFFFTSRAGDRAEHVLFD